MMGMLGLNPIICLHVFLSILFNVMITHGYNARDLRISSILLSLLVIIIGESHYLTQYARFLIIQY